MPRMPLSHRIQRDATVIALADRDGDRRKGHLGADIYDGSEVLAQRRREIYREALRELGVEVPKPN